MSFALILTFSWAGTIQLKSGSATVPVAPVGVPPTGSARLATHQTVCRLVATMVFGGTPKTAGETPALPQSNCIVPAREDSLPRRLG